MRAALLWYSVSIVLAVGALGAWDAGAMPVAVLGVISTAGALAVAVRSTPVGREVASRPDPGERSTIKSGDA